MLQDLTSHIAKLGDYPDAFGGFGEIWRCIYHRDRGPVHVGLQRLSLTIVRLIIQQVAVKSLRVYASDYSDNMERKSKVSTSMNICIQSRQMISFRSVYGTNSAYSPDSTMKIFCMYMGTHLDLVH